MPMYIDEVLPGPWPSRLLAVPGVRATAVVLVGTLLLAISARTQVPFVPVPFTMQTAVALGFALMLPPRLAMLTVGAYLFEGAAGLPVFAGGGGTSYLLASPTAGFLWGMVVATGVVVLLRRRVEVVGSWGRAATAAGLWTIVVFGVGLAWLSRTVGAAAAVDAALIPFLPSELLKIAMVLSALPIAERVRGIIPRA